MRIRERILKRKILKSEVISFDIFDTLIKRNCAQPKDIFYFVGKKLNLPDFYTQRIQAERAARAKSPHDEVTITEIYAEFKSLSAAQRKLALQTEVELELLFCQRNSAFYEIYQFCHQHHKKIICTSDMYLPKDVIQQILQQAGYHIQHLYLSSEYRAQKRSGSLFKIIIADYRKLKITPAKILHIGDSRKSDFLRPKLYGLKSALATRHPITTSSPEEGVYRALAYNNSATQPDAMTKFGYEILGPLCCTFCTWLQQQTHKQSTTLLFCARDMQLTQAIYNTIYGSAATPNYYFHVSRRSIQLPYLHHNNNLETFFQLIDWESDQYKKRISEITYNFNLEIKQLDAVAKKYHLDANQNYSTQKFKTSENFRQFYYDILQPSIAKASASQYRSLIKYLNTCAPHSNKSRLALVDLGWNGRTQAIMTKLTTPDLQGFYIGTNQPKPPLTSQNTIGFCINNDPALFTQTYPCRTLLEKLFSAQHGTTLGYQNTKPYYTLAPSGDPDPNILAIQSGAQQFAQDFAPYVTLLDDHHFPEFIHDFLRIGLNPTLSEAKALGKIWTDNHPPRPLAQARPLHHYLRHPQQFKSDFALSEWKIGFLRQLFRIPFPYYQAYKILKHITRGTS